MAYRLTNSRKSNFATEPPKQQKSEYFDAIFVFDGEKAPPMSVVSLSHVSIGPYQEWKRRLIAVGVVVLMSALGFGAGKLVERWTYPRLIRRFSQHASELQKRGELKSKDDHAVEA
jgi:hypothetical protein